MSELSNRAAEAISRRNLQEGGELAFMAVKAAPDDYHAHYAVGLYFRHTDQYDQSCRALEYAYELNPTDRSVLLALAISQQLAERYDFSVRTIDTALAIDRDFVLAYNTAGITLKLMGRYEEASKAYEDGAKAKARSIIKSMRNAEDTKRISHGDSRNSLWSEYAAYGTLVIAANYGEVDGITYPTGDQAERDRRTAEFKGWYWIDQRAVEGGSFRFFTPNYFNTFRARLTEDDAFANLMGNRNTVLRLMGQIEEADRHLQEAEDFSS